MLNIIFIAPPAAGKGTQSKLISDEYNIPHISTGDLLRDEIAKGSKLGEVISKTIKSGGLVSDEVITKLLKKKLTEKECKKGFILDGYPRNKEQAIIYNDLLKELNIDLGKVIFLDIDKDLAMTRTLSRLMCGKCGSSYNLLVNDLKPKKEGICDRCGAALKIREDDNEETFLKRFDTYMNSTKDLLGYYQDLGVLSAIKINKEDSAEVVFNNIKEILKK